MYTVESSGSADWIFEYFFEKLVASRVVLRIHIDSHNQPPSYIKRFTVTKCYGDDISCVTNETADVGRSNDIVLRKEIVKQPSSPILTEPSDIPYEEILLYELESSDSGGPGTDNLDSGRGHLPYEAVTGHVSHGVCDDVLSIVQKSNQIISEVASAVVDQYPNPSVHNTNMSAVASVIDAVKVSSGCQLTHVDPAKHYRAEDVDFSLMNPVTNTMSTQLAEHNVNANSTVSNAVQMHFGVTLTCYVPVDVSFSCTRPAYEAQSSRFTVASDDLPVPENCQLHTEIKGKNGQTFGTFSGT